MGENLFSADTALKNSYQSTQAAKQEFGNNVHELIAPYGFQIRLTSEGADDTYQRDYMNEYRSSYMDELVEYDPRFDYGDENAADLFARETGGGMWPLSNMDEEKNPKIA